MAYNPLCGKCGRYHFNFYPCDEMRDAPRGPSKNPPIIVRAERQDGLTDWHGDKLESFSERKGDSLRRPRPAPEKPRLAKPRPTLTYPEA